MEQREKAIPFFYYIIQLKIVYQAAAHGSVCVCVFCAAADVYRLRSWRPR